MPIGSDDTDSLCSKDVKPRFFLVVAVFAVLALFAAGFLAILGYPLGPAFYMSFLGLVTVIVASAALTALILFGFLYWLRHRSR